MRIAEDRDRNYTIGIRSTPTLLLRNSSRNGRETSHAQMITHHGFDSILLRNLGRKMSTVRKRERKEIIVG